MKWLVLFSLSALILFSCASGNYELRDWMKDNGKIKVVATTGMIADLVKQVGGDQVDVMVLIKGDLDPHSYQLVKGDDEKLVRADVIFANGLGLEHGPSLQKHLETNKKVYFLGSLLLKNYSDQLLRVQGQIDPHVWMDMSFFAKTIPVIVEGLSQARPEESKLFHENGEALTALLLKEHEEVKNELKKVPENKRYLVTSHDAFNYFARAYMTEPGEQESGEWTKRFQAPEGLSPESQLSSKDIEDILKHIQKYHITVIFPESNVSSDSLKKIKSAADEMGIKISMGNPFLYGDAMGPAGSDGDSYIKMLKHNAKTIAEDLNE